MKTNKKPILRRCFCFFIIFTMFISILPINAFASLYYTDDDGEFGMLIQEIAAQKGWQLGNSTATQWQSPIDGETHYRSSGSEQEHFDDFWTWQLDFVTSKPIEEGNKLIRQNPNAHIEDGEYDGINYKVPGSNHRYFDFIITNSDSWINNFNITLGGMGINPDSEFYQEFYDDDYTFAPGGHGVLAPNPAANVTKEEVIQWLLENFPELNDAQIAALLTNINYESGFNFTNNTGDAGHAWGLFQWNDRGGGAANPYASDKLAGWCRENFGIEWDDPENGWKAQLAFAMWESYGNESSAWNAVTAAAAGNDAYAAYNAADLFCKLWERPNAAYSNRTSVEEASANFDLVKAVRQQIKDGTFQAPGANNQSNSQHSKPNGQQQNQQNKQNYHGNNNNQNTGNNSNQGNNRPNQNNNRPVSNTYSGPIANGTAVGEVLKNSLIENNVGQTRYNRYWIDPAQRNNDESECFGDLYLPLHNLGVSFAEDFALGQTGGTNFFQGVPNSAGHTWDYYFEEVPWEDRTEGCYFLTYNGGHLNMYAGDNMEISASSSKGTFMYRDMDWIYSYGEGEPNGPTGNVCYRFKPEFQQEILEAAAAQT